MKTRIRDLRLEKRISQQALARHLCLNQSTLSKIERGLSIPDASLISDLSRFFHVSADYVLYLAEERLNADLLLANDMFHLKKYRNHMSMYQQLSPAQQKVCDSFVQNMLGISDLGGPF